ncbi:copper homeostasis protein CutC [Fibrisoma montanum]|uniref:PF03932 family protein CutC n=1 Tax=Fibrisoma montanum TaxID=2305895 RepID=A0A418MJD9_9BACT|nr:copper homeostasis protein CutC [Fibrisoma montanum]RIV27588.1 copper homeostasis protein CutC [Fibrisoma montanum]
MTVEVCAYSLASCLAAERAGATRIELCGGMSEGGITPSAGLIRQVRQAVSLPIYVMIRPRGGDFLYSDTELAVMQADIETARQLGADGLVLGVLHADGTVDEATTHKLVELARPLPVTFHRAFDMTRNPAEALEAIIRTGAERILTSGQQPKAEAGIPLLRELVRQAAGRIEIMAGAGVSARNAGLFREAGLTAIHLSGSRSQPSPMAYRQPAVSMASTIPSEYERIEADELVIQSVVQAFV